MNWKLKALVQRAVSLLPSEASYEIYYVLQRAWGSLRRVNPLAGLESGIRILTGIEDLGRSIENAVVLEVGTGRRVNVPLALWLCGAAKIITVDRNPYLKPKLIREDLIFIRNNTAVIQALFGRRADRDEFQRRLELIARDGMSVPQLLEATGIQYLAPLDARALPLEGGTIDYHVSNNVCEHIPPTELGEILAEGRRVVREDGLLVHGIDFSDHNAECDPAVSTINFLQYSERQWQWLAGSRYNYHNRLRLDEFKQIIRDAGLTIVSEKPEIDPAALRLLEAGFGLDQRFSRKPKEINATDKALVVAGRADGTRPRHGTPPRGARANAAV